MIHAPKTLQYLITCNCHVHANDPYATIQVHAALGRAPHGAHREDLAVQRWVGAVAAAAAALSPAVCCGFRLLMQSLCRINCRPYMHSKGLAKRTQGLQKMAMLSLQLSRHVPQGITPAQTSKQVHGLFIHKAKLPAPWQLCFEGGCCLTRAVGHLAPSSCGAPLPRSSNCLLLPVCGGTAQMQGRHTAAHAGRQEERAGSGCAAPGSAAPPAAGRGPSPSWSRATQTAAGCLSRPSGAACVAPPSASPRARQAQTAGTPPPAGPAALTRRRHWHARQRAQAPARLRRVLAGRLPCRAAA